jgi:peptide deformylase
MLELKFNPYPLLFKPVEPFSFDQDVEQLEKDMTKTMLQYGGIGLAANQVGIDAKVFVLGHPDSIDLINPKIFINPVILDVSKEQVLGNEGCLSFPGINLKIKRFESIEVAYQNADQSWEQTRLTGLMSRVFQHEFDHLLGVCFVDRASKLKLKMAEKKLNKNGK